MLWLAEIVRDGKRKGKSITDRLLEKEVWDERQTARSLLIQKMRVDVIVCVLEKIDRKTRDKIGMCGS